MPPIELANSNKNVLDGELLWKFLHLSIMEKTEIAKRIGTTVGQVCITIIFLNFGHVGQRNECIS